MAVRRATPAPDEKIGKKLDYVAARLGEALAPHGFKRKGRTLWRHRGTGSAESLQAVNLQGDKWNAGTTGRFCVNLGVQLPAVMRLLAQMPSRAWLLEWEGKPEHAVSVAEGSLCGRLSEPKPMSPGITGRFRWQEIWFTIDGKTDVEALATQVAQAAVDPGLSWMDEVSLETLLFPDQLQGPLFTMGLESRLAASVLLGEKAEATRLFMEAEPANDPESFEALKQWALRHGLDVADAVYRAPPPPPGEVERAERLEIERAESRAEVEKLLSIEVPVAERIPELLMAYLREARSEDPKLATEALLLGEREEVRRAILLEVLRVLTTVPRESPFTPPNVWGNGSYAADFHFGRLVKALLKTGLPLDEPFAREVLNALVALADRYDPGLVTASYEYPFAELVSWLDSQAAPWRKALSPEVERLLGRFREVVLEHHDLQMTTLRQAAALPEADEIVVKLANDSDTAVLARLSAYPEQSFSKKDRDAIGLLRKWLKRDADDRLALEIENDDWGRALQEAAARFEAAPGALRELFEWFAPDVPSKPSGRWTKDLARRLDALPRAAFVEWLETTLPRFAESSLSFEWATTGPRPGVGAFPGETSGNILLGLVHAATWLREPSLATPLTSVVQAAGLSVPEAGKRSRKIAAAAERALENVPGGREKLNALAERGRARKDQD